MVFELWLNKYINADICINTKNLLPRGLASSGVSFYNKVSAEGIFAEICETDRPVWYNGKKNTERTYEKHI